MIRIENKRTYRGSGVYIGRPSLLGNPYSVREYGRQEAIRLYRRWLWDRILEQGEVYGDLKRLAVMAERGDPTLISWCAPEPCHGDMVRRSVEWLNSGEWRDHLPRRDRRSASCGAVVAASRSSGAQNTSRRRAPGENSGRAGDRRNQLRSGASCR